MGARRATRLWMRAMALALVALAALSALAGIADGAAPDADSPKPARGEPAVEMTRGS